MPLSTARTALLIMDVQPGIISIYPREINSYMTRLNRLADAARSAGIKVIYVIVSFRDGHPEISPNNLSFARLKENNRLVDECVHPAVFPHHGELVVTKKRFSAFTGSDLAVVLSSFNINHLILCGISTSGVILSTLRQAADADYALTVISDCCLDFDEDIHTFLMERIFPKQACILNADDMIGQISAL